METRAPYATQPAPTPTPQPTPADPFAQLVAYLERTVKPIMLEDRRARVELHIKGASVSAELTLPEKIS